MSSFFSSAQKRASESTAAAAAAAASLPLVANVNSAFARFSTRSPSVTGESDAGGEPDTLSGTGSTIGNHIVCIHSVSGVCGGSVGAGGEFCCKARDECNVAKHERETFTGLEAGFYIKAGPVDAYTTPFVKLDTVGSEARQALLNLSFEEVSDIRKAFGQMNSGEQVIRSSSDVAELTRRLPPPDLFTPGRKKLKKSNLREKFDAVLEAVEESSDSQVKEEQGSSSIFNDPTALANKYLKELTSVVTENQQDASLALEKVDEVMSQVGIPPKSAPPSLWLGYMEHKGDIKDLNDQLLCKVDASSVPNIAPVEDRVNGIEGQLQDLYGKLEKAFDHIESQLQPGLQAAAMQNTFQQTPQQEAVINGLVEKVDKLSNALSTLQNQGQTRNKAVRIGKFVFQNMSDLEAWMEMHLPPNFPFGGFVDVYSFLQRVKSSRDIVESDRGLVSGMEERRKSKLTADESLVVESFSDPLPRCFSGPSSADKVVWIPGIKSKQKWESDNGTQGVKLAIKDNMEGIRTRVDMVISQRLGNYSVAAGLARELLSDTVTFLTALIAFISNTYQKLGNAGYPSSAAWDLVSKLVYRMFSTDCFHEKRGIATEMLDADDHRSLAVGILWGTFGTHMIMREYLKHDFADHPSISGEFTRFLVANAGVSKINRAQEAIDKLTKKVGDLEKLLGQVDKKATSASNKADEAHKAASRKANSRE